MSKPPNILIFMTDHQRADTVPPYKRAITPNLEEFIRDAAVFSRTYCTAPHCCPSRASFFSGLYPSEHGVWNNVDVGNTLSRGLNDDIRLFSEDLKDIGYKTFLSGKWHISAEEGPVERGFDCCYPEHSNYYRRDKKPDTHDWDSYKYKSETVAVRADSYLFREGYPDYCLYGEADDIYSDDMVVDAGCEFIRKTSADSAPWFAFIGVLGPHDPYFVSSEYLSLYPAESIVLPGSFYDEMKDKPAIYRKTRERFAQLNENEHKEAIRHYLAFCSYLDHLFGKITGTLKDTQQYNDTVIIYLSDHGDYLGEHGLYTKGLPGFSSAYHIPLLIGGGSDYVKAKGKVFEDMVSITDIAPTILDIANIAQRKFSGNSLNCLLKDIPDQIPREAVFTQTNGNELYGIQRIVMTKKWKFIYNGFDYDELYDLESDPDEVINLNFLKGHKQIIREMYHKLWSFAYDHNDASINPYVMVSHAQYGPGIIFD